MIVVGDGMLGVARARIVVGENQVSGSARWTLLENGRKEVFRVAKFGGPEIIAVARTIIEPGAAGELLGTIDWLGETRADGVVAEGGEERFVHIGSGLRKIKSDERVVSPVPDGGARLAASLHHRVRQLRAAVSDHVIRGRLTIRQDRKSVV